MNVLYCGDKHIADGVLLSALSLQRHCHEPLHIYVMTATLTVGERHCEPLPEAFTAFLQRQIRETQPLSTVRLIDATALFEAQPPTANLGTRFTPCCMLRLYADLVPQLPGRLLYLDNDVICCADAREMYYQPMDGYEVAGVLDHYGSWFFRRRLTRRDYLNSGVLLLELDRIRETGLFARCRRRCAERRMFMPDQSALNKLARRKKIVPRCYNEQRRERPGTVFRHFTTSFRFFPWFHTVTVKPWQTDRMHTVLKTHDYDDLLTMYQAVKAAYEKGEGVYVP